LGRLGGTSGSEIKIRIFAIFLLIVTELFHTIDSMVTVLPGESLMGLLGALTGWWASRSDCVLATEPSWSRRADNELEAGSLGGGTRVFPSSVANVPNLPQLFMHFRRAHTSTADRRGPAAISTTGLPGSGWLPPGPQARMMKAAAADPPWERFRLYGRVKLKFGYVEGITGAGNLQKHRPAGLMRPPSPRLKPNEGTASWGGPATPD